jgi:hypothetical protein
MPANLCKIPLVPLVFFYCAAVGSAQNADSTKSKQPVAIVEGETIYYDDLDLSVKSQLLRLRSQEYEIKRKVSTTSSNKSCWRLQPRRKALQRRH